MSRVDRRGVVLFAESWVRLTSDRLRSYIYGALKRDLGKVTLAGAQPVVSSVSCR